MGPIEVLYGTHGTNTEPWDLPNRFSKRWWASRAVA